MSLAILAVGCAVVLYVVISLVWQSQLPFDGVLLTELSPAGTNVSIIVTQPNELQFGDQVLAIGGHSVEELVAQDLRGETVVQEHPGKVQQYLVRRGGETLALAVPLQRLPVGRLLLLRPGVYLLALATLLVSGYILSARPDEPAARLLVVVAISLTLPLVLSFQSAHLVTPALFLIESVLKTLGMCLIFSGALHLFLVFPATKPWLRGRENWLLGLHGVNPALSALIGALAGRGPVGRLLTFWQSQYWIGLAMLLLAIGSIVHTYVTVPQVTTRNQIRWVAWGAVIGILPFILFTGVPEAISGRALLGIEATSFFIIVVPVAVAIAVARFRLFDIDTVIHRSLVYGLLMLLFTGVYWALVTLLNAIVVQLNRSASATTAVFLSALLAATGFWALRARLVRLLSPVFYRTRVDPGALLTEMSAQLSHALRLDDVNRLLRAAIPRRLGATDGLLMVLNEEGSRLEAILEQPFFMPLETVQSGWAGHSGEPVRLSSPSSWIPAEGLAMMNRYGVELAIPLLAGDQLVGVWGLGPLRSGQHYTSEEIRTLVTLSHQAAIAVQNARLVRRMETQNQELEETVRRRTQVLEEERNRLNAILQTMADGLLVTAGDGHVVLTNPALDAMFGQPAPALAGRPVDSILSLPGLAPAIAAALARPGQVQVHDLTSENRAFKASITALADRSAVVTLLRDITRETEVDRIKSAFISTVSHELRTPLTSILGFAKLTRRAVSRELEASPHQDDSVRQTLEQVDRNLDIVAQEGARLSSLIADALDVATLETGEAEWHDEPMDVALLVQQAVGLVCEEAGQKGLQLTSKVPQDLPRLLVDMQRIVQLLANLLSNAVKFTQQGEIVVTAQPLGAGTIVRGWTAPVHGAVLLRVRDTGIGIPAGELDNIFQRFYQVSDTLHDKPRGTGLGLAICQEIVNHYGGTIWAESAVGAGSTFSFTLPAPAAARPE